MKISTGSLGFAAAACAVISTSAFAQVPPSYGLDFVTIGAPGNRPTIPSEVPAAPELRIGAVGYTYRIMRTHVSNAQYLEFVNAYAPFWQGDPTDPTLTGYFGMAVPGPGGTWSYEPQPGTANHAARVEWQMAARYTNWLHNGKRKESWAFEDGVYDTSTFVWTPGGWTHQVKHSPRARFWMPTRDEYIKAVYYDPDRYGPGREGYWQYPDRGDEELLVGWPQDGGETIGDLAFQANPKIGLGAWDLGQYPHVRSPWGLIDISATEQDYTEHVANYTLGALEMGGSLAGTGMQGMFDRIDIHGNGSIKTYWGALRLVSVVPSPTRRAVRRVHPRLHD